MKRNLPISGDAYDDQIIDQIKAAALDLTRTAAIILPGEINITRDEETGEINDSSTVEDAYIIDAIRIYCEMRIGNPPNYDRLLKAYETMKGNMQQSSDYTYYPGDGSDADPGDGTEGENDGG